MTPYPVDYLTRKGMPRLLAFNLTRNLPHLSMAMREWFGLVAYRLFGWTDRLLPGPETARSSSLRDP